MSYLPYFTSVLLSFVCVCHNAHAKVSVTDASGSTLTLTAPAQRIISLAPHLTENTFSAAAGSVLIGAVDYSDYPKQAVTKTRVGDALHINFERIVELNPDLILAWKGGNTDAAITRLNNMGYAVYQSQPSNMNDVFQTILDISILAGTQTIIDAPLKAAKARYRTLKNSHQSLETVSVFYQIWHKPLMTLNGQQLISQTLSDCGGRNVFYDALPVAPQVSIESVISANPDAIFTGIARSADSDENRSINAASINPNLAFWQDYPMLEAVKNEALYSLNSDHMSRFTLRHLDGLQAVCRYLNTVRAAKKQP